MITQKRLDDKDLEGLPGVGPATKNQLYKIGIRRISDLILFLPSFLIDKTQLTDIISVTSGDQCLFVGAITNIIKTKGFKPNLILNVDIGGSTIQIRFIHKIIIYSGLKVGMDIRFTGIIRFKGKIKEMIHPEIEIIKKNKTIEKVVPYYKTRKLISQNKIRKFIKDAFIYIKSKSNDDVFDDKLLSDLQIPHYLDALEYCHFPSSDNYEQSNLLFESGRQRFIVEELLAYKLLLSNAKEATKKSKSYSFSINENSVKNFQKSLPFKLTSSQLEASEVIKKSFLKDFPTKRLIQGDVGSGKTVIAIIAALYTKQSGLQTAVLVPTEILADQHTDTFVKLLNKHNVSIVCLKNNISSSRKTSILNDLLEGNIDIVIGTHSLIQNDVCFKNLGLIIVDEQHKFGINQRVLLSQKNKDQDYLAHELYLSATPIPRSLSLVLYEGLEYTVIKDMPQNRKIISTEIISHLDRPSLHEKVNKILSNNNQVYWVCSCIDYTEEHEAEYVKGIYDELCSIFTSEKISMLHGRQDSKENSKIMNLFIKGKIKILVCTTMIEVGVDVPNATCIVIEDPNRFGLSQLHQLRGRVGRCDKQSYCYLVSKDSLSEKAFSRLKALEDYTSGFAIAEEDLKLRGAGEYLGNKQSGINHNFKLATPEDAINNYPLIKESHKRLDLLDEKSKSKLIKRWGKESSETIQL